MAEKKAFLKMVACFILVALRPAWLHAQKTALPKSITVRGSVQFISPQENKI